MYSLFSLLYAFQNSSQFYEWFRQSFEKLWLYCQGSSADFHQLTAYRIVQKNNQLKVWYSLAKHNFSSTKFCKFSYATDMHVCINCKAAVILALDARKQNDDRSIA